MHLFLSNKTDRYSLVTASKMLQFAPFLCFTLFQMNYLRVLDCWLDKTRHLKFFTFGSVDQTIIVKIFDRLIDDLKKIFLVAA